MRFSLRLNNDLPVGRYLALAEAAERWGFDQLWISNDLFLRSGPALLAAVLRATSRLQVGSGILNPHTIHPVELAMLAATLDELSGNRFNLGVGAGAADFLGWIGRRDASPLVTVRETIDGVRALLAGQPLPAGGRFLTGGQEAFLRFPAPRVTPIYVGAMGPGLLRLAGERADGVLPLLFPPEHFTTVRPLLDEGAAQRMLTLPPLDVAACLWVSLDDDPGAARRALAAKVAYYGHALGHLILERLGVPREAFEPIARVASAEGGLDRAAEMVTDDMLGIGVWGSPADLRPRLEWLVAQGVRHLSFGPPLGPDPLRAVELLGRQVLPHFRPG